MQVLALVLVLTLTQALTAPLTRAMLALGPHPLIPQSTPPLAQALLVFTVTPLHLRRCPAAPHRKTSHVPLMTTRRPPSQSPRRCRRLHLLSRLQLALSLLLLDQRLLP